jgi:hypothetical protein
MLTLLSSCAAAATTTVGNFVLRRFGAARFVRMA